MYVVYPLINACDAPHTLRTGSGDVEQSRPSSSGGRLEQHLGAVESVDTPSPAAALVPSAPVASRTVGFPAGPRVAAVTVAPAVGSRHVRDTPIESSGRGAGGEGGFKVNGVAPTENLRAFKGGSSSGANFCSSGSRTVVDDHYHIRKVSDAGQQSVGGRRVRDRKGNSRRRSADGTPAISTGADSSTNSLSKGVGAGRGKADGGTTRARRAAAPISFGSSIAEGGTGADRGKYRGSGGGRRGGERGGEAGNKAGRAEKSTQDNKFRMQAGQSNTLVAVRLRPLLKHDREHVEVAKVRPKNRQRPHILQIFGLILPTLHLELPTHTRIYGMMSIVPVRPLRHLQNTTPITERDHLASPLSPANGW